MSHSFYYNLKLITMTGWARKCRQSLCVAAAGVDQQLRWSREGEEPHSPPLHFPGVRAENREGEADYMNLWTGGFFGCLQLRPGISNTRIPLKLTGWKTKIHQLPRTGWSSASTRSLQHMLRIREILWTNCSHEANKLREEKINRVVLVCIYW